MIVGKSFELCEKLLTVLIEIRWLLRVNVEDIGRSLLRRFIGEIRVCIKWWILLFVGGDLVRDGF